MNKKINDKGVATDVAAETELKTRRKALKSIIAASGVVAGSQALSSEWTRPLVESVVLPAHAQTSLVATGTFTTGRVGAKLDSIQPWYARTNLLDSLISPAHAAAGYEDGVRDSVCGGNNGDLAGADGGGYQIMLDIEGSNVDVCVSSLGNGTGNPQMCTREITTTIDGQNIADVDIPMDNLYDLTSDREVVQLRNIIVDDALNSITGRLDVVNGGSNSSTRTCGGEFTCNQTATAYSCNASCSAGSDE
ncbi:MAG: hypothetical protein GXP23_10905 [Gammaproteobacteria bacterium]|nr:hypothetical protein [Gammaproteobacteria bacterium]